MSADCAAYVLFTSGTTGIPKGVVMDHRAVTSSQIHRRTLKGYTEGCRVFQFSSYTFDTCIDEIFMTLGNGGCVCVPSEDARMNGLASAIRNMAVELLEVTPTVGRLIVPSEVPSIKTIVFGGEYMSQLDFAPWKERARVFNTYGPTECCVECVISDVTGETTPGLIGKAAGSSLWIVTPDDHNRLAPIGAVGELLVEGPALSRGYLNDPQNTAASFIEDPHWLLRGTTGFPGRHGRLYKTGDLVKYVSNGSLIYVGRKDTQVKINGQRLELGEVEAHVSKVVPEGTHVIADILSYPDGTQALAAFIRFPDERALENDTTLAIMPGASDLQSKLFQTVPRYMVPTVFFKSRKFPMTLSGKTDRNLLRESAIDLKTIDSSLEKETNNHGLLRPISSRERKLQQIWATVLKLYPPRIGANDSFFELGGDSIAAIKVAGLARKQGIKVAVVDIFKNPRLCDLAAKSTTKSTKTKEVSVPPFSLLEDGQLLRNRVAVAYKLDQSTIQDLLPCTPLQEGLLSLTTRDSGEYMIQKVLHISDDIDAERFCMAWEASIELLPILRTRMFLASGYDGILQGIIREGVHWKKVDRLNEYLELDRAQPMGLGDSLARYALVDNGNDRWFVWTIHHCLYDGWTMPRMLAMVERAYQGLSQVQPDTFNSFVKSFLKRNIQETQDFWKSYLAEAQVTRLPKRALRTGPIHERGLMEKKHAVAFENKRSYVPSTIIRTALGIVLSQLTGSDDVIFGTTVSGRYSSLDNIEDIMGPTIATVPVRVRIEDAMSIGELLAAVQEQSTTMMLYEHEGLHNIGSLSQSCQDACKFETYLIVQQQEDNSSFESGSLGRWQGESGTRNRFSTYPLMIECFLGEDGMNIQAQFDQELISPLEMERMIDQFHDVLNQLLQADSSQKLHDLKSASMSDVRQIFAWNEDVPQPFKQLLHHLFTKMAKETPEAMAINAWDGTFTYSELDQASSHLAKILKLSGVKQEIMVPIFFEHSKWAVVAMLAVLKADGVFVPLDPHQPALRRKRLLEQAHGPVIITSTLYADLVHASDRGIIVVEASLFEYAQLKADTPQDSDICTDINPECAAYILFTSGSTGEPKGVVMPHRAVSTSLTRRTKTQGFGPESRVLQFASYTFDVMIDEIFMTILSGGCVCIPSDDARMSDLSGAIRDLGVNTIGVTPTVARQIEPKDVPGVTTVMLWGEAVSRNDLVRWGRLRNILLLYGPTEACIICVHFTVDADNLPYASMIGKTVGATGWVVNARDHNQLVPIGAVGELLIEGPGLARGYLNNDEKTQASFIYDPEFLRYDKQYSQERHGRRRLYKTGDLVRYDVSGSLVYLGRKDDAQIKLNGQRVELGEVEIQLAHSIPNANHIVADIVTLSGGQRLLAAFINFHVEDLTPAAHAKSPRSVNLQIIIQKVEIENEMLKRLPRNMIPSALFAVEYIPRTLAGKVDRKQLREAAATFTISDLNQKHSQEKITRPLSDNERKLRKIWADTLKLDVSAIFVTDNFFELGGNSVTAMIVASQARRQAMEITVADIIRSPRICDLAANVKSSVLRKGTTIPPFSLLEPTNYKQVFQEITAVHGLSPDTIEDLLPCSPLQEGLLSLTSLEGDYVFQRVLQISENVEINKLCKAWEAVVHELPILRTRFFMVAQHDIIQAVLKQGIDWIQAVNLEEYLKSDIANPMGLGDPMSRYAIITSESGKERWFVWTIHHSLYDGWVLSRILDMAERAYNGRSLGKPIGFGHFIKYFLERDKVKAGEFWRSYLADLPIPPQLLKCGQNIEPARRAFLRKERALRLEARDHVPSTFIRAAMGVTLGKITGLNDVVFGTTVTGRGCPVYGIEDIMGPTIATVPVRVDFKTKQTVKNFLDTLQSQAMAMLPFEHEGLQNIGRMSQFCRDACQFQAYLVIQQDHPAYSDPGTLGEWRQELDRGGLSTYPVVMECYVREDSVEIRTSFNSETVSESEMEGILDYYFRVLEKLLEAGARSLRKLQDIIVIPEVDLKQLWGKNSTVSQLVEFRRQLKEMDRKLAHLIEESLNRGGSKTTTEDTKALASRLDGTQDQSNGPPVDLEDIEYQIGSRLSNVVQAVADFVTFLDGERALVAFVLLRSSDGESTDGAPLLQIITSNEIRDSVSKQMPQHLVPAVFFSIQSVPRTITGNVDRQLLREAAGKLELYKLKTQQEGAWRPPSKEERELLQIWATVLELEASTIGVNDNFFRLGGDSVSAMKVAAAARAFGRSISASSIVKYPTIAQQIANTSIQKDPGLVLTTPKPHELVHDCQREEIMQSLATKGLEGDVLDILPTTDFQSKIVMDAISSPESALNYICVDLGHSVNLDNLQNACKALVDKIEIFRTVFVLSKGKAWQVVLKRLPVKLAKFEVQDDSFAEIYCRIRSEPCSFDVPTLSFNLARTRGLGYRLLIGISHAQYDGLSVPMNFD
ncbi:acetyl-CoA synthetase-like protein [Didymella exigua CBS 183.55]|uniref:Acetyl-CoA synthetase-like protein n=1 Tax=Didymella exigua CBS 183.55 TaxID=1150837 RepID=A0A6A5S527_9PLEO|nr:acetyl-CoA synthetase-like protein [Didymella exigua CBS 183.55]KAF1934468.1 acetyl-CoA synthetase-like protein [Didymella exigua CBS 183.55]